MLDRGTCRTCKAAIIWVKTEKGKKMPLDATPTEAGMFFLDEEDGIALYGRGKQATGYTSHFATCPQANQHRKPKS